MTATTGNQGTATIAHRTNGQQDEESGNSGGRGKRPLTDHLQRESVDAIEKKTGTASGGIHLTCLSGLRQSENCLSSLSLPDTRLQPVSEESDSAKNNTNQPSKAVTHRLSHEIPVSLSLPPFPFSPNSLPGEKKDAGGGDNNKEERGRVVTLNSQPCFSFTALALVV